MAAFIGGLLSSLPLTSARAGLPPGAGLTLIQERCLSCHDLPVITTQRKPAQQWADTLAAMAARGAELSPDEMEIVQAYLARYFSCETPAGGTPQPATPCPGFSDER